MNIIELARAEITRIRFERQHWGELKLIEFRLKRDLHRRLKQDFIDGRVDFAGIGQMMSVVSNRNDLRKWVSGPRE